MVKIRKITEKDLQKLTKFNAEHFSKSKDPEDYFNYRYLNNPYKEKRFDGIIIAEDEENKIVGQNLLMPTRFKCNGKIYSGFWGMDYFVNERARNSLAGLSIGVEGMKIDNHFGLGLSPPSVKLHLALKGEIIGHEVRFYKITNYLTAFYQYLLNKQKKITTVLFPKDIESGGETFSRISNPDEAIIAEGGYLNDDVLEFSREPEFLKWRFFYNETKYVFYKHGTGESYFVVRPIIWKKMNCLLLVDYRFRHQNAKMFESILSAINILSEKLKFTVVLTGCSLSDFFPKLRRNNFKRFGNDLIVTVSKFSDDITEFKTDNVSVTFADSDSDFNYGFNEYEELT
jgi:hypothetical protein